MCSRKTRPINLLVINVLGWKAQYYIVRILDLIGLMVQCHVLSSIDIIGLRAQHM